MQGSCKRTVNATEPLNRTVTPSEVSDHSAHAVTTSHHQIHAPIDSHLEEFLTPHHQEAARDLNAIALAWFLINRRLDW